MSIWNVLHFSQDAVYQLLRETLKKIFNETPNRWLIKRRLQEALFLIKEKKQRPTDIYIDLGFEDLSHFSFAFKKEFGISASSLS
ncbi:helix-turn-helix domain-containing protein [Chryseobacterium rhizosphaerae]|uniref:helix-turn-helix domain-containing protein n=1 Tax=Chryseobacterium rhizosphaerae TaxID=395937 RepID=UPI00118FF91E|nr:helix-turn-helix domain-containing protein [Chryseobacterium rhizosphaerae]GEN67461.1 hypothetical protein CRH01_20290 [Chryseobacterium rhizosphaerae]